MTVYQQPASAKGATVHCSIQIHDPGSPHSPALEHGPDMGQTPFRAPCTSGGPEGDLETDGLSAPVCQSLSGTACFQEGGSTIFLSMRTSCYHEPRDTAASASQGIDYEEPDPWQVPCLHPPCQNLTHRTWVPGRRLGRGKNSEETEMQGCREQGGEEMWNGCDHITPCAWT